MSNSSTPFGFRAFGHRDGSAPTMGLERVTFYSSDTSPYFTGDAVCQSTTGGLRYYIGSTDGAQIKGVFAGCEMYVAAFSRQVWSPYFPGSVGSSSPVTGYLITDPEMQFLCISTGAYATSSNIGGTVTVVTSQSSLGNTTTGLSNQYVTAVTTRSNSSDPFMIVDFSSNFFPPSAPNTDGSTNYNMIVVAPNHWVRHAGTVSLSS